MNNEKMNFILLGSKITKRKMSLNLEVPYISRARGILCSYFRSLYGNDLCPRNIGTSMCLCTEEVKTILFGTQAVEII